jgi:hypothetical protein
VTPGNTLRCACLPIVKSRNGLVNQRKAHGFRRCPPQKAADRFSFAYQPSVLEEPLLLGLRRTMRLCVPENVDRRIGSDPATTQNNASNPKTLFNSANRPAS